MPQTTPRADSNYKALGVACVSNTTHYACFSAVRCCSISIDSLHAWENSSLKQSLAAGKHGLSESSIAQ